MTTTSGSTYILPRLNGPVEPLNRQFYKTQRWNVKQNTDLGNKKNNIIKQNNLY